MSGQVVPDSDHIARLCGGSHMREDGTPAPTAFRLRTGETYLSVNWLEFLDQDRDAQLKLVRRALASKRKVGATAHLAVLDVGLMRATVRDTAGTALTVQHEPEVGDPSHSGIHGMTEDDTVIADLIASVVSALTTARE